jgi:hypothetical protein
LQRQLRDVIAPKFGEILATERILFMETAGNVSVLSEKVRLLPIPYFERLGISLTDFIVTGVSLPDEVEERPSTPMTKRLFAPGTASERL